MDNYQYPGTASASWLSERCSMKFRSKILPGRLALSAHGATWNYATNDNPELFSKSFKILRFSELLKF